MVNIVALIPARGGSKRLPKKNIKIFHGKPLIFYSIAGAMNAGYFNGVYVSTEDSEIKKISMKFGAKIIDRPSELAEDNTTSIDVILHALEYFKQNSIKCDVLTLLQPTSPLRESKHIKNALDIYFQEDCSSVISFTEFDHSPYWSFEINSLNNMIPLYPESIKIARSQDLKKIYRPNGAIYIANVDSIKKNAGFFSEKIIPYIMTPESSIDIDNLIDFKLASIIKDKI